MTGVSRDRYGLRAYVKVGKAQREKRFKPETPLKKIQEWRDETRVALRALPKAPAAKGTVKADGCKYLAHMKPLIKLSTWRSRVCEIEAWYPTIGQVPRHLVTRAQIMDVRHGWLTAGLAPKTCNHRVRALRHLYRTLDGSKAPTPCDDVPKLKEPPADPKFVSPAVIRRVARTITDPKTRGRFMVLASTGQRPAQLKRAEKPDVDLRRRLWMVRPAKGGQPIPVILTDDMMTAFKVFKDADAWGDFDGSDYAKRLYAAGWPKHIRPYNTKHTIAITLAEAGSEWEDTKDWFGQRDVKTTRIYTGLVLSRFRKTSARLAGRIGW